MNTLEIVLTAFSLAMDAFMVCLARGIIERNIKEGLIMIITFSFLQTLMPIIGYSIGDTFSKNIINYSPILSSILLITIGILIFKEPNDNIITPLNYWEIFLLGIATSIDALVIGVSLSFLNNNIYTFSLIIGIITGILCSIGFFFSNLINKKLSLYSNRIGGITLIIIGLKSFIIFLLT